ncbi:hypothetical protein EDEG_01203 [Edhazardia aedis USNM 41457]|uniref:Uncharacterized protein n=1 Tax=Edhazardia aedis (strain USNM 41457) TaxID=1003232 RepID=J9DAT6_EDHAE|nr:hypothetical protein EDEG_01203 [Edhazardia aedis USNM 41457]|eukprot:EJW04589.1 hypothetical protein EDEG_01203 [Edhazardia aedis USNM 41457]
MYTLEVIICMLTVFSCKKDMDVHPINTIKPLTLSQMRPERDPCKKKPHQFCGTKNVDTKELNLLNEMKSKNLLLKKPSVAKQKVNSMRVYNMNMLKENNVVDKKYRKNFEYLKFENPLICDVKSSFNSADNEYTRRLMMILNDNKKIVDKNISFENKSKMEENERIDNIKRCKTEISRINSL